MIIFTIVYFESRELDIFILLSYKFLKANGKVILKFIEFFKKKQDLLNYLEQNDFDLFNDKNSIEKDILISLQNLVLDYISGKKLNFSEKINELNIDPDIKNKFPTQFSQKVVNYLIKNVKYGDTTTYSDIGNNIGSIAYRAIGNVMRNNPLPLIIPCHRVLKKNGELGGFMGKMDQKWQQNLKMNLLRIEGSWK